MFETGIRQLRLALGMVGGKRLNTRNLARLVGDALATLQEFGEPGADVQQLVDGPFADPEARDHLATRGIQRTAARLAQQSPFYQRRFAAAGITPGKLKLDELGAIPVTVKSELVERPAEFRCADTEVHLTTRTTGTTGKPAEVWLSKYEIDLWAGLGALSAVLRDELRPTDIMQVHSSSRATAAVHLDVGSCRLAGAGCRVLGIVPPDSALDGLTAGGATIMATYPSYLAELVVAARRRGLGPDDFPLRRIQVGGEVLSPSLKKAAYAQFGVESISDSFGMTEVIPVTARTCGQGHLHHDINTGYVEYLDLDTGEPARPGALATVVITPFFPYRDCMPVFRYDTRDVVRLLPDEPLTCEVSALPACGPLLGKADHLLRAGGEVVTGRQLTEAVEALPSEPWPGRYRASVHGGRLRLALPTSAVAGLSEADARAHFAAHGLDVAELTLVPDSEAVGLRPLRTDLHELTFAAGA
ncbi:phenylacetate--CoA ligase family protein [Labedaea rhizosphaerae]|uniref:Phenylacetate-coenzyme A ligase PaaK-like adenylate-forming protein n=1 Tax=Labedaea rhizosphaerae TaxID=598644 RepID=A0A4R6SFD8_LABRH|nr:AMP-binding protein [Labedaea rhizosphaerae]TDQ00712.1 phenylacetate-coenzyme A ligase PaaK-like adenylate-forming protein [Labedaea rhizosphaerae]